MKKNWFTHLVFNLIVFCLSISVLRAQNNCPALPKKSWIDTLAYIKTEIPTDPSKTNGIWLGQGTVKRGAAEFRPGFIPSNHPTWALAIAHAWNYSRNLIQRVEYPSIGYWMATLVQESELACVTGTTWSSPAQVSNNMANATTIMNHTGCYQIEGPGSAYSALGQAYPYNRFPTSRYSTLMEGPNNQETSSLVKAYYDIYTSQVFNYNVGWDFYENIDCKRQHDAYAYEKMSASAYNGGPNAFLGAASILTSTGPGCWTGLPATTAGYANDIAKWTAVMENNTSYCDYPTGSTFGGYYNENITWTIVSNYLTIISVMYPEINFATQVTPYVQTAFIAKAGAIGNTIPFQQLGSVIDAIILHLPLERPQRVEGSPVSGSIGCSGAELPYGHVEILNGSNTMCLGNSVTLELIADAGGGVSPTYKWYTNSVAPANLIGTNKTITITPSAAGVFTYAAQICNANGCYTVYSNNNSACDDTRNINGFKITVTNCSACSFTAAPVSLNTPCKGMRKGRINLTLTNAPANYTVSYTGSTSLGNVSVSFNATGNTVSIVDIPDGSYNIVLENSTNSTCKAYSNVVVGYTSAVNEMLDASKTQSLCLANVAASIVELPAPCNWKVQAYVDVFFQWENPVNFGVVTSTGISTLEKSTRIAMKPEIDLWNDVPVSEQILTLNTGDKIDFYTALTNTPGAQQIRAYTIKVFNENNVVVHTVVAPAGAAQPDAPYNAGSYTVTCPNPTPPTYTFVWSPSLTSLTNTSTGSTGTVNINFNSPTVYTVSAQHPTNSQCILTDTVLIQPTCPGALPVEFLSVEASVEGTSVQLYWVTANEDNCALYAIERSKDGIHFETIGSLNCNNSVFISDYFFTDQHPYAGMNYYRVREEDRDGTLFYSSIERVTVTDLMVHIQPNPFDTDTRVTIEGTAQNPVKISVTDMNGKLLTEETLTTTKSLSLGNEYLPGVYLLQVTYATVLKNYKLVKQ